MNLREHWENIYNSKQPQELSWYEPTPEISLQFVKQLKIPLNARIIDIGGGDSLLVDKLLELGYQHITVLDISETAINKAKRRLGIKANLVQWKVCDILQFSSTDVFDFWHDRAAFHFLTSKEQVNNYLEIANNHLAPGGKLLFASFSTAGPEKCSGLTVHRYSKQSLTALLQKYFEKIRCIKADHLTPFNTIQHFLFCSFQKLDF
jgi:SAM-dependent methyltransferase